MEKIKIFKSKNKHRRNSFEERGYGTVFVDMNFHIYIYKKNALLLSGGLESDSEAIDILNNKYFKITPGNLEYLTASKGQVNGSLSGQFLIDFDSTKGWYSEIFEHNGSSYSGIKSIGLTGSYIDTNVFKAYLYNCFGGVLFEEDEYTLIYEGEPPVVYQSHTEQ